MARSWLVQPSMVWYRRASQRRSRGQLAAAQWPVWRLETSSQTLFAPL